ncbi:phage tail tape measure protein [Enterobacter cloacae]|uniref:phage tail tape measure protein n=1 Tax=Enterobacter cloacae TaxID=550 RepID=UPI000E476FA5|nr:phage tail tape measure protein [Enterobacter cloacae]RHI02060.1 phage tail tape measure protein [Enterobacter cloacae]
MSNNIRLQALLDAVARASRPLKAIQNASLSLEGEIGESQAALRALDEQAARVDGFRKTSSQLTMTGQALALARQQTAALARELKNTQNPTREQNDALTAARQSAAALKLEYNTLRQSVQRQRGELAQAGINTRTLAADERRLRKSIGEKTQQLNGQREALARVNQQQERLNAVQRRYESGKRVATRVHQIAGAGVSMAKAGVDQTSRFMAPGISAEKQMSAIQASLGLEKGDVRLEAIRQQARDVSAGTGTSTEAVTRAQTELVRSGYDAGGVLAATLPAVNLSLAGNVDAANAADIISNAQTAFNLANTDAGRVADVLTRGFTSSHTSLTELGAAVASVAPIASGAGVSLEETTALLGILMEKGMKGSTAGAGVGAVLSHLQMQNGQGSAALGELNVQTHDGQGNLLPAEQILTALSASFEKSQLGTAQQMAYLKTIFGQENAQGAAVLVSAAGNGTLSEKRQQLQGAKGSTARVAAVQSDNLAGDIGKLQAVWNGLKMDVFDKADGALRTLTTTATGWISTLSLWVNANPALTQGLVGVIVGAQAFAGIVGGLGTVVAPMVTGLNLVITAAGMLGTAFSVVGGSIMAILGALSWPIIAIGAAIAAGALLIFKYWEPVSAFFTGVMEGLSVAFAPLVELFSPLLQAFGFISEKLGGIWQWFTDLITPIKATQETLDSCKNAGVMFGQMLGEALMAPLDLFNSLSSKATWLLDKLGLIKTESDNIEPAAANAGAASSAPGSAYIPPTSTYGGYLKYQPALATGGRSYVDQSRSEYHFTLQGDMTSGADLSRQIQDALDSRENQRAANQRSRFMYE